LPGRRLASLEVGIDFGRTDASADVVLVSDFPDRGALEQYMKHPEHVKVAEFIGRVRTERILVDYEV
jgi:hypothetical protein